MVRKKRPLAIRDLVLMGLFSAILFGVQLAFAFLPNVELVSLLARPAMIFSLNKILKFVFSASYTDKRIELEPISITAHCMDYFPLKSGV